MAITEQMTVAEIASKVPASVRIFQRYGIDFCCGGKKAFGIACREQGASVAEVSAAIDAAATQRARQIDWNSEPLSALVEHIIATYHGPMREELPRLEMMATKVARVHGGRAEQLTRIESIVRELAADLRTHMWKEEHVLFPAIRVLEERLRPAIPIAAPIAVMEQEHDRAGDLLALLRSITDGYAAPSWACATFQALYCGLAELEVAMHVHVHLENNILFPRAQKLQNAA